MLIRWIKGMRLYTLLLRAPTGKAAPVFTRVEKLSYKLSVKTLHLVEKVKHVQSLQVYGTLRWLTADVTRCFLFMLICECKKKAENISPNVRLITSTGMWSAHRPSFPVSSFHLQHIWYEEVSQRTRRRKVCRTNVGSHFYTSNPRVQIFCIFS